MLYIHYRLSRVFVDRFKSTGSESEPRTAGESTRQMGEHVGGCNASCGTLCERDTHQRGRAKRAGREMVVRRLGNKVEKEG